jgi:AmiR/NasT family two-component response regulator
MVPAAVPAETRESVFIESLWIWRGQRGLVVQGSGMASTPIRKLNVLVADARKHKLDSVARVVERLGHSVIVQETDVAAVVALTEQRPLDVAIVAVSDNTEYALELIGKIVREATCPVIALLDIEDPAFIHEAAKRGVFAYLTNGDATDDQFESSIDVVLHRFAEYHDLEGAFGRRAITERAKGVLMERHSIDEETAFRMLRDYARNTNTKLIDVAQGVLHARALLPARAEPGTGS